MNTSIMTFNDNNLISLQTASTSKGNQQKWYDRDSDCYIKAQFFYQDKYWRDDLVEVIGSSIGEQLLSHGNHVNILHQELCKIQVDGRSLHGVYSKNFCRDHDRYISFQRILDLNAQSFPYTASITDKWVFVLNIVQEFCDVDLTNYLIIMSLVDFLVGNEDRHLNNFGLLTNDEGYRQAPLFDFGLGFFEHDRRYEGRPLRECLRKMECKPFHRDNKKIIDYIADHYSLKLFLPDVLNLEGFEFPSAKSVSYILNRCRYLGLEVEGIV